MTSISPSAASSNGVPDTAGLHRGVGGHDRDPQRGGARDTSVSLTRCGSPVSFEADPDRRAAVDGDLDVLEPPVAPVEGLRRVVAVGQHERGDLEQRRTRPRSTGPSRSGLPSCHEVAGSPSMARRAGTWRGPPPTDEAVAPVSAGPRAWARRRAGRRPRTPAAGVGRRGRAGVAVPPEARAAAWAAPAEGPVVASDAGPVPLSSMPTPTTPAPSSTPTTAMSDDPLADAARPTHRRHAPGGRARTAGRRSRGRRPAGSGDGGGDLGGGDLGDARRLGELACRRTGRRCGPAAFAMPHAGQRMSPAGRPGRRAGRDRGRLARAASSADRRRASRRPAPAAGAGLRARTATVGTSGSRPAGRRSGVARRLPLPLEERAAGAAELVARDVGEAAAAAHELAVGGHWRVTLGSRARAGGR